MSTSAHYGDCAVEDAESLERPGHWSVEEAWDVLVDHLLRSPWELGIHEAAVIDWVRRDLPELRSERDRVTPEQIYERIAASGVGEAMFASGEAAAANLGYGDELRHVDRWSLDRFVGLGCPWLPGLPADGQCVVDLGCGAGVDLSIAAHQVGASGTAVGIDRLPFLAASPDRRAAGRVLLGSAADLPLANGSAELVVANGLPALLGARSAPPVLDEVARVLAPRGAIRFSTLVVGPDKPLDELTEPEVINAVRCSKPTCAQYRRSLGDAGFGSIEIVDGGSPFISGYRAAPVRAVLVTARLER